MDSVSLFAATGMLLGASYLRARSIALAASAPAATPPAPLDPNLPIDAVTGRIYHLQVSAEELSPRILSVGDTGRAERIAALFDASAPRLRVVSSRGFVTHTGYFNGVRVSVVATGMGTAMMDFVVRECRALLEGPMIMLRYGTCGGLRDTPAGAVAVASGGAVLIRRDVDAIATGGSAESGGGLSSTTKLPLSASTISATPALPYAVSRVALPHARLAEMYASNLRTHVTGRLGAAFPVVEGINATADGFYASQGRTSTKFPGDRNGGLLDALEAALPSVVSLEMETHTLMELAEAAGSGQHPIAACGAAMVVWNRHTKQSIDHDQLTVMEVLGGRAALETLAAFQL